MFELCVTGVLVELCVTGVLGELKMPAYSNVAAGVYCLTAERKCGGSEVECSVDEHR